MRRIHNDQRLNARKRWRKKREEPHLDPLMRALKALHSANMPDSMSLEELERQRKGQDILGRLTANLSGLEWTEFDLSGMACAWARPEKPHRRPRTGAAPSQGHPRQHPMGAPLRRAADRRRGGGEGVGEHGVVETNLTKERSRWNVELSRATRSTMM